MYPGLFHSSSAKSAPVNRGCFRVHIRLTASITRIHGIIKNDPSATETNHASSMNISFSI